MKEELTIEQKAKRYDEAIEVARKIKDGEFIKVPDGTVIPVAIFPELNENKDEMIKTAILNHLKIMWGNCQDNVCGVHVEDAIDWLEKQSEKKPVGWNEEDEHKVKDIIYFLNSAKVHYASDVEINGCIKWLWTLLQRMG